METKLAWAAGLIDGEGCIYIMKIDASRRPDTKSDRYILGIRVTMGHKPTLLRLVEIFGHGTVQNHVRASEKLNQSYTWVAQSRKAHAIIQSVRPFLVTKAEEADVALAFADLPRAKLGGPHGCRPLPLEIIEQREYLYQRLRELKPTYRFRPPKLKR